MATPRSASLAVEDLPSSFGVLRALECFQTEPRPILFDSASRVRERDARYSFLTADPILTETIHATDRGFAQGGSGRVFARLREWQAWLPGLAELPVPTFVGGIAGMLSYEFGEAFECLPRPARDEFQLPVLIAGLYDWCIVWDHIRKDVKLFVLTLRTLIDGVAPADRAAQRFDWVMRRLSAMTSGWPAVSALPADLQPSPFNSDAGQAASELPFRVRLEGTEDVFSTFTKSGYIAAVDRVVEYIRAGDIFQANLSQQLSANWPGSAFELYARVRQLNPAPFCAMLTCDDFSIVSASPERFLKVRGGRSVETRPIKGTRRRQRSPIADLFTTEELHSSEKDRAENVMIVDLLRNDLSRNCRPGSVRVTGLCEIELFETVQHLVSTVVGELRPDRDVWDLVAGCFPGGSITGAPKIRAMQIIAELEPTVRGAYCGSLFCLGPNGDFDSSILIRTFTLKNGRVLFPVGGGIVADSNPEDEYRETLHKASGMLRVIR